MGTLVTVVTRTRIVSEHGGFFDPKILGKRLADACKRFGVEPKTIAGHVWPHRETESAQTEWYKKASTTMKTKKFSPAEIDRATAYFRIHHSAPTLWPLVDWDEAEAFDDFRKLVQKAKR